MIVFGVAMTITTGCWIAGVPTLIQRSLHEGAGGFSIVMIGFAVGSIATGAWLARVRVRRKARASMLAWMVDLPAYLLLAVASSVPVAFAAAVGTGAAESSSYVLLNSAAQEEIPDEVLGRVLGVISFVHRGSHLRHPRHDLRAYLGKMLRYSNADGVLETDALDVGPGERPAIEKIGGCADLVVERRAEVEIRGRPGRTRRSVRKHLDELEPP